MAAQPTPAARTGGQPPIPMDMSITIYHPVSGEAVGLSFAVTGTYSCPQGPTPFISCTLQPPSGPGPQPLYLHYSNGKWEAYFENVTVSDYVAKATIKHDKNSPGETQTTVGFTARADPGVTTNTPDPGVTKPANRSFDVKGTVDSQYANSQYYVAVYGTVAGSNVGTAPSVTPGSDGTWTATLTIPNQASDVDIHSELWQVGGTVAIAEGVIGRITIS